MWGRIRSPSCALAFCLVASFILADDARSYGGDQNGRSIGAERTTQITSNHVRPPVYPRAYLSGFHSQNPCETTQTREDEDLCQQWRMAQYAENQAKFTRFQVYLTIAEIVALLAVLWLTIRATNAAVDANRIARETANKQLRAYVGVSTAGIIDFNGRVMHIRVSIKNSGQTPANSMQTMIITENGPHDEFPIPPNDPGDAKTTLFPGVDYHIGISTDPMSDAEWQEVRLLRRPLFVWGRVTYRDAISPEERETTFRFRMNRDTAEGVFSLNPCEEGNHAT